jgi:SAM-dependent methyltransferase
MPERDYLRELLREYPRPPSYAFWRAVELRVLSRLSFQAPVLDLGCGDGRFARMLLGAAPTIVGTDLSHRSLRAAASMLSDVAQADATKLPFADGSFRGLLSNCVLEHIPDDEAVVREISRVLAPGGMAALTVPAPGLKPLLWRYRELKQAGRDTEAEEYLEEFDARYGHIHYRTDAEWRGIITAAGMQAERVEPYLPAPTVAIWNRLETQLMQPLAAITDYWKLLAYALLPGGLRGWLMYRWLRRYSTLDVAAGAPHGGWLVVARKPD